MKGDMEQDSDGLLSTKTRLHSLKTEIRYDAKSYGQYFIWVRSVFVWQLYIGVWRSAVQNFSCSIRRLEKSLILVIVEIHAHHYCEVIMGATASQFTSPMIVYSTVHSGADHRKYQSSASLAFVGVIHPWPVNSPHKWPVTRKIVPLDDVIMGRSRYT